MVYTIRSTRDGVVLEADGEPIGFFLSREAATQRRNEHSAARRRGLVAWRDENRAKRSEPGEFFNDPSKGPKR